MNILQEKKHKVSDNYMECNVFPSFGLISELVNRSFSAYQFVSTCTSLKNIHFMSFVEQTWISEK